MKNYIICIVLSFSLSLSTWVKIKVLFLPNVEKYDDLLMKLCVGGCVCVCVWVYKTAPKSLLAGRFDLETVIIRLRPERIAKNDCPRRQLLTLNDISNCHNDSYPGRLAQRSLQLKNITSTVKIKWMP